MSRKMALWIVLIYASMTLILAYSERGDRRIVRVVEDMSASMIADYYGNDSYMMDQINSLREQIDTNKALLKQLLSRAVPDDECLRERYPKVRLLSPDVKLLCVNDKWAVVDVKGVDRGGAQ